MAGTCVLLLFAVMKLRGFVAPVGGGHACLEDRSTWRTGQSGGQVSLELTLVEMQGALGI